MTRLTHIRLLVEDFRACVRWYNEVLGFPIAFDDGDNYADLQINDSTQLGITPRALMEDISGGTASSGHRVALIVRVDDPDAEQTRLRALGVEIVTEATDRVEWGLRTLHVRDPDGNIVELYRPLEVS